jgi:hypothetical protein
MRTLSCNAQHNTRTQAVFKPRSIDRGAAHQRRMDQFPSWPGFVPAIHVFLARLSCLSIKTWMPGTSPGMTNQLPGLAS